MLPDSSIAVFMSSGKVRFRPDRGWEQAANEGADTVALGLSDADYGVRTLRAHTWSGGTHELPDRAAGRRRAQRARDRLAGPARATPGGQRTASVSVRGLGWLGSAQSAGPRAGGHAGLAGGIASGDRSGPTQRRG